MVRPQPCVLFAQSFLHPRLAEHVDEVRFTEPVVICACEILELHTSSLCPTLSLSGVSFPQSFALELFVRSGGEARFKRLCPAFLYSPSASSVLEVQAAVTDHLVIRGSYRALSLVVYGNSAKDLGQFNADHDIDSTLSDLILQPGVVFTDEDLPQALQEEIGNLKNVLSPLKNLQLVYQDPEQSAAMYQLLSLAVKIANSVSDYATVRRVLGVLVSAASAVLSEHGIESGFPQWPTLTKTPAQSQRKVKNALKQARDSIQAIKVELQDTVMHEELSALGNESTVMEVICNWIQRSFQMHQRTVSVMSVEEYLMGGLAAVQLLCTDAHWCFQFVVAGGMHLLMNVLHYTSAESSATALLVLGALKCACQHAFACEALLGWWPVNTQLIEMKNHVSIGYCAILKLLLQTRRHNVAQLASQVLHHLHAYELVSEFQCGLEPLLENSALTGVRGQAVSDYTLKKLNVSLKELANSLNANDFPQDWSPAQMAHWSILDGDDNAFSLPPNAVFSWITASKYSFAVKDLNAHILSVLQERRFIPFLAALLSAPWMRSALGRFKESFLEFVGNVEALILALISSRSGLLFLASDQEAAAALVAGLVGMEEFQGSDFINLRHARSLMSAGFLCKTQDVGHMLHTSLSVVGAIDRLLDTSPSSESFLWLLWELSVFSRSETGKQALSAISHFPEVFLIMMEALQPESHSVMADIKEGRALKRAVLHSAAEVMQVILMDPVTSSLALWIPHALSLQKALQYCSPTTIDIAVGSHALGSGSKDALCARLLDWVDAAVIFHKKGPVGLLRYAAALVAGSVTSIAVGGLPTSDAVEPDNTMGESAGSTELPTVDTLLGRGVILGALGTVLPDAAVIQLTVSMRIMSSISCHPGMAAVLYGEGAMAILYILLEYGVGYLQTSTTDYDYIVEEDSECDGITEMILEQGREQSFLGLLLPTLLLLLNLLRRLQVTEEEYRNTKLVETLLQLHRCICARLASRVTVPTQAGGMLVLASVSRVLASVLAFWPVCSWTPSLFPKLLGANTFSLVQTSNVFPLEPKEAVSVLLLLGDMLPEESPMLCSDGIGAIDMLKTLAVPTLLGVKSMKVVGWHCEGPHSQKLIQAVGLHLDQISLMVSHLACTTSTILQGLLIKLTVRIACQNEDYAAALVRPILTCVKESTLGPLISEIDIFRVERVLELLKELAKYPATKRVLLREGIVQVLIQAIENKNNSGKMEANSGAEEGPSPSVRFSLDILHTFVAICDPDISMVPNSPVSRRFVEDCPSFVDQCSIATSLYNFLLSSPMGEELEIAAESMGKIVSHQLGRAAFASIALSNKTTPSLSFGFQKEAASVDVMDDDLQDTGHQIAEGKGFSFVPFCKRLGIALAENADSLVLVRIIDHFAMAAIQLSAAGRSVCGLGALQLLFEMDKMETKEVLSSILSLLKKGAEGIQGENGGENIKIASQKAVKTVTILLRLLENLPAVIFLEKKVKMLIDGLNSLQPLKVEESKAETEPPQWRLLPALNFETNEVQKKMETGSLEELETTHEETIKDKFTWECAAVFSADKQSISGAAAKRKSGGAPDGGSKKHRTDGASGPPADVASSVNGSLTGRGSGTVSSASASSRRDTFRQRKPNTSRPPSMHVDDYVARERGGSDTIIAVSGGINQRGGSGGGRPPSIHVDEFMARQRDRQQVVGVSAAVESQVVIMTPPQSQIPPVKVESASSSGRKRPTLLEEDGLQDVDIEIGGVSDTDDLLSLSVADELVLPASVAPPLPPALSSSPSIPASVVDESVLPASVAPPLPPPLPPPPPIPAGVIPEKYETSSGIEQRPFSSASMPAPSFDTAAQGNMRFAGGSKLPPILTDHPRGISENASNSTAMAAGPPPPPPPMPPPGPWHPVEPGLRRMDPVHGAQLNPLTFGTVAQGHLSGPAGAGTRVSHAPLPQWSGMSVVTEEAGSTGTGRPPPPLPPTPPPFSSTQVSVLQVPSATENTIQHSASLYAQNIGRLPSESRPLYTLPSGGVDMPSIDSRFPTFPPSMLGQSSAPQSIALPSSFQPPLPPGRPNISHGPLVSSTPPQQQQHFHQSQILQPSAPAQHLEQTIAVAQAQITQFQQQLHQAPAQPQAPQPQQQQESGKLLQQILASPDAIQDLLKDQNKLQNLLEQHPKLISLLQEKMGQG